MGSSSTWAAAKGTRVAWAYVALFFAIVEAEQQRRLALRPGTRGAAKASGQGNPQRISAGQSICLGTPLSIGDCTHSHGVCEPAAVPSTDVGSCVVADAASSFTEIFTRSARDRACMRSSTHAR